jgi:putative SOS response-associated peptidase YedK
MTNLYRLDATAHQIEYIFDADAGKDPWAGGYVAPEKFAPIVVEGKEGRRIVPRYWGVPPPPKGDRPVTTVRNVESPFWIGTLRHTEFRCLIPVTGFALWGQTPDPDTGKQNKHWFTLPAEPIFAFAGIWRDSEVASFAVLTTDANALVAKVNPKTMPAILHREDHDRWLHAEWSIAQSLIEPYPEHMMQMDDLTLTNKLRP